jgi:hypothetical protein
VRLIEDDDERVVKIEELEDPVTDEELPILRGYTFNNNDGTSHNDHVNISVGCVKVPFVIDSGASQNIIDKNTWQYMKSKAERAMRS